VIIYRLDLTTPPAVRPLPDGQCRIAASAADIPGSLPDWARAWGWPAALKIAAKVLTGRRVFFFSRLANGRIAQSGWANIGFCRYYPVEPDAVVLGTLLVTPDFRNRGYSTAAKSHVMHFLFEKGYRRFYSDTTPANRASQRTSEKLGFKKVGEIPVASEPS
jgi:RimJ/RimL family protein N-acetyltransferase